MAHVKICLEAIANTGKAEMASISSFFPLFFFLFSPFFMKDLQWYAYFDPPPPTSLLESGHPALH